MSDLVQRLRQEAVTIADLYAAAGRIEQLEQRESELVQQCGELNDEINRMRNEHARQVEQLERSNKELTKWQEDVRNNSALLNELEQLRIRNKELLETLESTYHACYRAGLMDTAQFISAVLMADQGDGK